MSKKELTVERYEEIKRLLDLGISGRAIAKSLSCSRKTVTAIREGEIKNPSVTKEVQEPIWTVQIDWNDVLELFTKGHFLKYIWEEKASSITSYVNFWRYFLKRFPEFKQRVSTHREFQPGERCEVDYAGYKPEWVDARTGEVHVASIFLGTLGFSQYIFACVKSNAKSKNFLESHREMYEHFGGVPSIAVPDCLKQGVVKCHLYDPDLNPAYIELIKHYDTAVVPARPRHPKDKAIVEGAVKLVTRYFKFLYRNHTFYSVAEIDQALKVAVDKINKKTHTRFKTSRYQMWLDVEKNKLKPLPSVPFEYVEWKIATVHPDCHISLESNYYSVPHIHRGKKVKAKIGRKQIEIFLNGERIALHSRLNDKCGKYLTDPNHLPPNSLAYHEATPKNLLSQARFLNPALHNLIKSLFEEDTIANIRRAQGLIRTARKEVQAIGYENANKSITLSCNSMTRFNKIRVPYFKDLLKEFKKEKYKIQDREIKRTLSNPMIRYKQSTLNLIEGGKENGNSTS